MAKRSRSVVSTAAGVSLLVAAASPFAGCGQKGPLVAAKTAGPPASVPADALLPVNAPGALLPASGPR